MHNNLNSKEIEKILNHLNKQEFDFALERIQNLSVKFPNDLTINKLFASTYFKKKDWLNVIKYSEKNYLYMVFMYKVCPCMQLSDLLNTIKNKSLSLIDNSTTGVYTF